jgi:predicted nucleic acid-binding protein
MLLIDTSVLIEWERGRFDLPAWLVARNEPPVICDATRIEFLAGEPLKDEGKRLRFRRFVSTVLDRLPSLPLTPEACRLSAARLVIARAKGKTVPLGDALHAGAADAHGATVVTIDRDHFTNMGLVPVNPLDAP